MPYIKEDSRKIFDKQIENLVEVIDKPGELTYCLYSIFKKLTERNKKFSTISSIIGEIECAKLEFYRRIVSPYENTKIRENGDIE